MDNRVYDELEVGKRDSDAEIARYRMQERIKHNWVKLILAAIFVIYYFHYHFIIKHYEYVEDFHNIAEPVQTSASGSTIKTIDGVQADIQFVAKYQIDGIVISKYKYYDN